MDKEIIAGKSVDEWETILETPVPGESVSFNDVLFAGGAKCGFIAGLLTIILAILFSFHNDTWYETIATTMVFLIFAGYQFFTGWNNGKTQALRFGRFVRNVSCDMFSSKEGALLAFTRIEDNIHTINEWEEFHNRQSQVGI